MESDAACRVCRSEATPDQPLFNPCKCRGSMKYIHQECLEFWLNHSNKNECDICHTKFHFNIIYDQDTPKSAPISLMLYQLFRTLLKGQYFIIVHILHLIALTEIFCAVHAFDTLLDTLIGVPITESSLLKAIFPQSLQETLPYSKSGTIIMVIYIIFSLGIVLTQNSITTDRGFPQIVRCRVGLPTRISSSGRAVPDRRVGGLCIRVSALLYESYSSSGIQHLPFSSQLDTDPQNTTIMRNSIIQNITPEDIQLIGPRFAEILEFDPSTDYLVENKVALIRGIDRYLRLKLIERENPDLIPRSNPNRTLSSLLLHKILAPNADPMDALNYATLLEIIFSSQLNNVQPNHNVNIPAPQEPEEAVGAEIPLQQDLFGGLDFVEPILQQQARAAPAPAPAVQVDELAEEPLNLWNLVNGNTGIWTTIQYTALINLASLAVLIIEKFLPSMITVTLTPLIVSILKLALNVIPSSFISPIKNFYPLIYNFLHSYSHYFENAPLAIKYTVSFMNINIVYPIISAITNIANGTPSNSLFERILAQISGILILVGCARLGMWKYERIHSSANPLTGNSRLIYSLLLQFVLVFKVVFLLLIEWLFFPIFCGAQIEFALVPVFNDDLFTYQLEPQLFPYFLASLALKWITGTFFMYFFASFVSMIRSKILREGVMFFIRPSDDPNVEVVHEAIMRPFLLRVSRIALSAAVYSVYIHVQLSVVSWSLRVLLPDSFQILPFHSGIIYRYTYAVLFIAAKFMTPFFLQFWRQAFDTGCHIFRLSDFLLFHKVSSEQGYIAYRSFTTRIKHWINLKDQQYVPDYSTPIHKDAIQEYFQTNPATQVCFVVDGNYVRAPNNDHVSRKFVRTLFVPVTNQDQLLAPIPQVPNDEAYYNPYNDTDPMDVETYAIVYRPPNFKARLILLFFFLWSMSLIFTAGIYFSNMCIGKLILKITGIGGLLGLPTEIYKVDIYSLIITFIVLSQSPHLVNIFRNSDNNVFIFVRLITNHVKTQINRLNNEYTQLLYRRLERLIFFLAKLHASGYGWYLLLNHKTFIPGLIFVLLAGAESYATRISDMPALNKITAVCVPILVCRAIMAKINPVAQLKPEDLATFNELLNSESTKAEYYKQFLQYLMIDFSYPNHTYIQKILFILPYADSDSTEAIISFVALFAVEAWIASGYIKQFWTHLSETTKESFFPSNKILANVDEDEEEE